MSAPMMKSQMAFELPKLSYIDTHLEEPAVAMGRAHGFATWFAGRVEAFRAWRVNARAMAELNNMTDRELVDVGLNRCDIHRLFDNRYNEDLRIRVRAF